MAKKIILVILTLFVITGALAGIKALQFTAMFAAADQMGPPPESVSTVSVNEESWRPFLRSIGSVAATQGVVISTEVAGTVSKLSIESGSRVEAGAILVELDASTESAELESAEASLELAQTSLRRLRDLRASNSASQSDLDSAQANARQAAAEVERLRAVIAKKTIRAPFDGQLGIRRINLGQYLAPGTSIVSLQAIEQVHVDFSLPQQKLSHLQNGLSVEVTSDSFPDRIFEGTVTAINSEVEVATRNIRVQATLENPDGELRPGMFTNISVFLPERENVIAIPSTSVVFAPYGNSVYVVEPDDAEGHTVRQQFVRLGAARGDFVTVTEGLHPGETIVMTGAFKLRNGAAVTINNDLAPEAKLQPTPADS